MKGLKSIILSFIACVVFMPSLALGQDQEIPTGDTFIIKTPKGDVKVNNFYKTAKEIDNYEVWIIEGEDSSAKESWSGSIAYQRNYYSFRFSIDVVTLEGFKKGRQKLQEEFLKLLGITEADACKLAVSVMAVNKYESWSGTDYGLSYCPKEELPTPRNKRTPKSRRKRN